jgi:release factor glutamine methyltransferase
MSVNIQTIKDIRFFLSKELTKIYPEPELSALCIEIIKSVTGVSKFHQIYKPESQITPVQAMRIVNICNELKTGKPLQYVMGETFFYNCIIRVNQSVLIPRPETEELVDLIIKENKGFKSNIIDFGTGSGCIAIALALNLKESSVTGIDISEEAIMIARQNAELNKTTISFLTGDIFNFEPSSVEKANIIVSNPPYVRSSEKSQMRNNVLDFEPHVALFVPDEEPLLYYKSILKIADKILLPEGRLYFEINESLGKSMEGLLKEFRYSDIQIINDINNKERIIKGMKHG